MTGWPGGRDIVDFRFDERRMFNIVQPGKRCWQSALLGSPVGHSAQKPSWLQ
jgi:hypothetical protein